MVKRGELTRGLPVWSPRSLGCGCGCGCGCGLDRVTPEDEVCATHGEVPLLVSTGTTDGRDHPRPSTRPTPPTSYDGSDRGGRTGRSGGHLFSLGYKNT